MAGDANARWPAIDPLPDIVNRLRRVRIAGRSACDASPRLVRPVGLICRDPQFAHETRSGGGTDVSGVEVSNDDH
ncbi:MAG: hypothetical protein O7D94_11425, partial [Planctomycetota bacterium]|nr:hypothetical protein [Planctomycetota bacterium]